MSRLAFLLVILLCACTSNPLGWNTTPAILDAEFHPINRGWGAPVWQDEFNGTSLDTTKWVAARFCGGYNHESQCYTDRRDNISFSSSSGALVIWAEKAQEKQEMCDGTPISAAPNEVGTVNCPPASPSQPDYYFSSGRIHTRVAGSGGPHAWKYGRIEVRAALPDRTGTWTAFWMLPVAPTDPWPQSGEIDLMEAVNLNIFFPTDFDPADYVQSNIHLCSDDPAYPIDQHASATAQGLCQAWGSNFNKVHNSMSLQLGPYPGVVPNLVNAYHTYAMEWSDVDMRFFVDDQFVGQVAHGTDSLNNAPFRQNFYLIINLAIGGDMPGPPIPAEWVHRTRLAVDWVRVYACGGDPTARNCIWQGQGLGKAP